ncbi:EscU/YscU/HrcU family type III secretion system export apparatus switch protein [Algicola sagamiensis]|uniref:EscU/YscU/HrcU family type III secretion system export apparatus switch protein n=1 Tax=Algicola sagamiensis TaxID=163869 RepID=UPI0003745E68|nr:EscU/YscU/HrcU family type III secretion system export apparatus switch protein [Algicola sagamiensis]
MNKQTSPDNIEKAAVALKYNAPKAPEVVAKGYGPLAEELIRHAEDGNVLIHEDPMLNQMLSQLEVGEEIPRVLYVIIAELIAFSYVLQGKKPDKWRNIHNKLDEQV